MSAPEKPEPGLPAPGAGSGADELPSTETGLAPVEVASPPPPTPSPEERVLALQAELDGLKEQILRKRAEFENYRRRTERERQNTWNDVSVDIFRALVPTLDNLERALQSGGDADSLREGVALIQRELMALLEARGVMLEDPTGKPFDPERHQALSHEVAPAAKAGTVVETFRKGYLFRDRLLRPALVKVAREESTPEGAEPERLH